MNRIDRSNLIEDESQKKGLSKINVKGLFDVEKRKEEFSKKMEGKKVDHEFQEIGIEMSKHFKGNIWWIFSRPNITNQKMREAFRICKERNIFQVPYLLGILKNL